MMLSPAKGFFLTLFLLSACILYKAHALSYDLGGGNDLGITFQEGEASCVDVDGSGLYKCTMAPGITEVSMKVPLEQIEDAYPFSGLAFYYSGASPLEMKSNGEIHYLDDTFSVPPSGTEENWVGWRGRYKILMVLAHEAERSVTGDLMTIHGERQHPFYIYTGLPKKIDLEGRSVHFEAIAYSQLWVWLKYLCLAIQGLILAFLPLVGGSWGGAILLLAIILKIALFPLALLVKRSQTKVSHYQSILNPKLKEIKEKYDGEEAHNRIMAVYKDLGISPFFTLKPMLSALIQIPILIATFNVLGEMFQLQGAHFLWISNLAYPDQLFDLPFSIPFLGNSFNLLPFIMTMVTVASAFYFQDKHAPASELKKQKRNLYLMALGFFILFYPFPAVMVLYWTLANLLQLALQPLLERVAKPPRVRADSSIPSPIPG